MATVRFFLEQPRKAGYKLAESEAEPPNDAESDYFGHGYLGRWTLHIVAACPRMIILAIYAQRL